MRKVAVVTLVFMALALYFGSTWAAEKVIFSLNWAWYGPHVAFFPGVELKYYEQEGLDVEIVRGYGSGDVVKRVDTGTVTFGLADLATVVLGRAGGAKVKAVGGFYAIAPHAIFSLEKKGIKKPKDLEGKTLAFGGPGDANWIFLPAFAALTGLDVNKVKVVQLDPTAEAPMLLAGKTDADGEFIEILPRYVFAAAKQGDKMSVMRYYDYGFKVYGLAFIAQDKTVAEKPELVRKFLRAVYKSTKWAIENPEKAAKMLIKHRPELDEKEMLEGWKIAMELILAPEVYEKGLGYLLEDKVQFTIDTVGKYQGLKAPVTTKELYTNEFLTKEIPKRR